MSYQVIALKWRPQNFQNMIGQKHISQTLENALKTERLSQAMLFTGPRGTGKTSTARILAKSLRCPHAKNHVPCGQCGDCQDIALGRSLDVIEIDGASNNGVDAIRELRDSVSFRPSSGTSKVYIIDEVHMLSLSAFNALLKTLEEPPEHVVFILATTEVHKIPKTILSRCHRFDFRKISVQDVAAYLEKICKSEDVKYESEALWAIARQGQGSVRDSLSFLDQVITYSESNVTYENVRESLGLTDRRLLSQIMKNILNGQQEEVMASLTNVFATGTDINVIAQDLLEDFKNLLVIKSSENSQDYLDLPSSEIQILKDISENVSEAHIHLLFDMMLKLTQDLFRTQDQKTVLEVGVLKLCLYPRVLDLDKKSENTKPATSTPAPPKYAQEAAMKLKIKTKQIQVVQQKSSEQTTRQENPQIEHPVLTTEQKRWDDFVSKIKRLNVKVGATLQNCHYELGKDFIKLAAPKKLIFIKSDLSRPEFEKVVTNYIKTFLGPDVRLQLVESLEDSGSEKTQAQTLSKQKQDFEEKKAQAVLKEINASQAIQGLKETFKEIEIISVKEIES